MGPDPGIKLVKKQNLLLLSLFKGNSDQSIDEFHVKSELGSHHVEPICVDSQQVEHVPITRQTTAMIDGHCLSPSGPGFGSRSGHFPG